MQRLAILLVILCYNCGNKKTVQLPEIENAEVTQVVDISVAYVFYDETQPDSTLFNRKNLISTTNWLVNIDKRLVLDQAIPHIQFLQNKRQKASMHKNENAKNYFTCNDISISNLGFLEFTDVNYRIKNPDFVDFVKENTKEYSLLYFNKTGNVAITNLSDDFKTYAPDYDSLSSFLSENVTLKYRDVILLFDGDMTFQDYIRIKSELSQFKSSDMAISSYEFIY